MSDRPVISRQNYPHSADPSLFPHGGPSTENCYVTLIRTRTTGGLKRDRVRRQGGIVAPASGGDMRWIGRATTSQDFLNWSKVEMMDYISPPGEQIYTNNTSPYFRARHLYIGLAARIVFDRPVITKEEAEKIQVIFLPERCCGARFFHQPRREPIRSHVYGNHSCRTGFGPGDWTSRNNYPALNIVPTGENEMSLYVEKGYGQPSHHLRRYTLQTGSTGFRGRIPEGWRVGHETAGLRRQALANQLCTLVLVACGLKFKTHRASRSQASPKPRRLNWSATTLRGVLPGNKGATCPAGWNAGSIAVPVEAADVYALRFTSTSPASNKRP